MEDIAIEIRILDYLQGRLSETERSEVENLRKSSTTFDARFNEVKQVWEGLGVRQVPEMDASVKSNFQAMLKTFELEQHHEPTFWGSVRGMFTYTPKHNFAYAILLVCFGAFGAFLFLKHQSNVNSGAIAESDSKTQTMLSMLENPTAIERMKAVGYTQELLVVNDKVIEALLTTLDTDPNENVRLVTLDALVALADNPKVRAGLVNSIIRQDSELMQVALANAMLHLQEKSSLKPLKKLLENQNDGNALIKEKLAQTVQQLESI